MTSEQFEELKAIQDAYLEMANKRQEVVVEEQLEEAVGGFGSHYSKSEKEKEMADDHKGEKETSYRSKSPKRSGFSALDRLKAKQGIKEEEVFESERSEKYKTIVSSLDRMRAKATANAELQKLQKQNKDHKKLPEEVEELEEEKIPVNHAHDAVGSVLGQSAAVKFATNLKAGTAKHTTWKDINKTLVKQGEQTHHIAKIAAKLKPAQYNEEIEELDEVSMSTLDSYRKKAFAEPGNERKAGRALAYDKSGSHGDSKVKSSEEIANAKFQIKTLIKPEHHSKYPISKITSHTSARKIYKDASAAGHLKEEVELDEKVWDADGRTTTDLKKQVRGLGDDQLKDWSKHPKSIFDTKTKKVQDRIISHEVKYRGKVKEEVELDEKELTDIDVKQKEKVVKGMKKNLQSFKDKYGERAKGVMYATATKIAQKMPDVKEEVEELEELSKATLGSYIKKASDSGVHNARSAGVELGVGASKRKEKYNDYEDIASNRLKGISKAVGKLTKEEVELEEAKKEPMEVYHTGYSAALQHAEKHLNKQGYDIHPDDWQQHISHGPSKPSEGKTVQLHVPLHKDGVKSKKVAHIQVYNRGNTIPKNNELNMYVN